VTDAVGSPKTDAAGQAPGKAPALRLQQLVDMLYAMMLIRRFEERTMQSYMQQKIGGFCHIYIGQEAVAVGSGAVLRNDDPTIGAYRTHGLALARGMDPKTAMAEMFGKTAGCSKGKGGSMHLFDKEHHMYGGHAIVGGQIPLGVGLAFAVQYEKTDNVVLCFLGDGALNQGALHESMNLAAIWNLPIIFVLENNLYSMGTHINRGTSMADQLSAKAEAYGMRYAECDGLDVMDVYHCFKRQVQRTRGATNPQWDRNANLQYHRQGTTPGPCFINVKTYRYKGHSMSDPQKYRSKDEVADHEDSDCISRLSKHLLERQLADQNQINALDKKAKKIAQEAVAFADQAPDLTTDELYTDVYANPFGPYE
jgi:pyruvate dehydrogenase E1 component alpha subunit